jgi:hypothetical protein
MFESLHLVLQLLVALLQLVSLSGAFLHPLALSFKVSFQLALHLLLILQDLLPELG